MKIITFFNNKGGIGETPLLYHTASMFATLGSNVMAVDLDPQTNLSQLFLEEERFLEIVEGKKTIKHALRLIEEKQGDITPVHVEKINSNLFLVPGDLDLSLIEDKLSQAWHECLTGEWYPFALQSSIYRIIKAAAEEHSIDYVFIGVGPNFSAINRIALLSSDYLIVPSTADLFSLKGLSNIGERVGSWFAEWEKRLEARNADAMQLALPMQKICPLGYVLMQFGAASNTPVRAYKKYADRIPGAFRSAFKLDQEEEPIPLASDPFRLATIRHYNSLMQMATEAKKPIFMLRPADGAIGAHHSAVRKVYDDFERLSLRIMESIDRRMSEKETVYAE